MIFQKHVDYEAQVRVRLDKIIKDHPSCLFVKQRLHHLKTKIAVIIDTSYVIENTRCIKTPPNIKNLHG